MSFLSGKIAILGLQRTITKSGTEETVISSCHTCLSERWDSEVVFCLLYFVVDAKALQETRASGKLILGLFSPASPGIKVTIQNCPNKGHHLRPRAELASEELSGQTHRRLSLSEPTRGPVPVPTTSPSARVKSKGSQGPDVRDPGHHPGAIPRSPCRLSGAPDNSQPILLTFFPRKGWELERREAGRSHTLATPGRRLQRPAIGPPQVPSCPSMPRAHSPRSARIAPHT